MTPEILPGEVSLTWLLLRTSGIVTIVLLTASVVAGTLSTSLGRTRAASASDASPPAGPASLPAANPSARLLLITIHTTSATTGLALLALHLVLAVGDSFVAIPPLALVVPGVSGWEPLWIGLGAVAVDLIVVLAITTATRMRAPRRWRRAHLLAYPAWVLSWAHALGSGTDAAGGPMLFLAFASTAAVAGAVTARLLAGRRSRADASQPAAVRGALR